MPFEMAFDPEVWERIRRWRAEAAADGPPMPLYVDGFQVGQVEYGGVDPDGSLVLVCRIRPELTGDDDA